MLHAGLYPQNLKDCNEQESLLAKSKLYLQKVSQLHVCIHITDVTNSINLFTVSYIIYLLLLGP